MDQELQDELAQLGIDPTSMSIDDIVEAFNRGIFIPSADDDADIDAGIAMPTPPKPRGPNVNVQEVKFDKDYERLVRMTQVFGKFASTLLSRRINVVVDKDNAFAPAWSDSDSITFSRQRIGKLDKPEVVTSLRGLMLHELAHVLMTPRDGTQLVKMVRQAKVWQAFNALEDMRIETFMTARYSNVSDWLTATVAQFLLDDPDQIQYQFPLMYGRKYLPSTVRIMVRDAYQVQQDIAELEQLIDNYIVLNLSDPATYKDAFAIILRYDELVKNLTNHGQQGFDLVKDVNGHKHRNVGEWKPNNGKPLNKQQQQGIVQRIKVTNGAEYDKPSDPADGSIDGDPSPKPTHGDVPSTGAGNSSVSEHNMDALKGVLQSVMTRRQEDIIDTIRQFNGETTLKGGKVDTPQPYWRREDKDVHPESVQASRSFGTELEQLRADHDPAWHRRTDSGRLNVQRYIAEHDVEEAFDQWDMGREDAVDIECVIALDISGSMDWCIDNAYESMWAIKRALDKVNASTTVVAFDTDAYMLYRSDERASTKMRFSGTAGGTDPKRVVNYANNVLAESDRAIKVFIAITDGDWYDSKDTDAAIMRLRQAGVITSLAYISRPSDNADGRTITINNHGCEVAVNITDARDLFTLARKLVKVGVARNLA